MFHKSAEVDFKTLDFTSEAEELVILQFGIVGIADVLNTII